MAKVASVMIEIKRSLYLDEATGERLLGFSHFQAELRSGRAAGQSDQPCHRHPLAAVRFGGKLVLLAVIGPGSKYGHRGQGVSIVGTSLTQTRKRNPSCELPETTTAVP